MHVFNVNMENHRHTRIINLLLLILSMTTMRSALSRCLLRSLVGQESSLHGFSLARGLAKNFSSVDSEEIYKSISSPVEVLDEKITGPYKIAQQPLFAVVEVSGTQYKVTPDDLIVTEKVSGVDVNDVIRLNRVMLLGSKTETIIGRPYIQEASVTAAVEEQFLDGKVIVFKKRRRKNSRRTNGHRQPLTSLRIMSVNLPEDPVINPDV